MVGDCESEIEMADTVRSPSTRIHLKHGTAEAGSNKIAGLPEEAVRSFERAMPMSPVDPLLHRLFVGIDDGLH